jgi:hypothetical protein
LTPGPASNFDFQVALLKSPITAKRITAPMTALIISAPLHTDGY